MGTPGLVVRLRQGAGHVPDDIQAAERTMDEAADEIERQQADIDRLVSERQGWLDEVERLRAALYRITTASFHGEMVEIARRTLEQQMPDRGKDAT